MALCGRPRLFRSIIIEAHGPVLPAPALCSMTGWPCYAVLLLATSKLFVALRSTVSAFCGST